MEASNLGQILGRLMYADERRPAPPAKKGSRKDRVLELVRLRGETVCADVAAALEITTDHAAVVLGEMFKAGQLVRSGERRWYRYMLP